MEYSVPVNSANEVSQLVASGASELYCGYLDAWWASKYGDHDSASRRQGLANLSTPEELKATVHAARSCDVPIHLALNARYTEPQLDYLEELCVQFESWGGTGIIVSDLGLLWRLRNLVASHLELTLSLLAVAQNVATLRAYSGLGISRVVFPRFVGWLEAGAMLAEVPGIDAGVMAFFDKCPLVDGYCRHRHGVGYMDRPQGSIAYESQAAPLYTFDTTYRTHACLGKSRTYLEPYPCAACHLRFFERAGVKMAKIGGRGRPLEERLRALRFLHAAELATSDRNRKALYWHTFGQKCACYYGKSTQSRQAIEPLRATSSGERVLVGSESSVDAFLSALANIARGSVAGSNITMLVPPLSARTQNMLVEALPQLAERLPHHTHIAANDLGTLVLLARALKAYPSLELTMGTLLARLDDPREVEHFLREDENPSRCVWDASGSPRVLTYATPTDELVRHWHTPSNVEPSAQEALRWLCGVASIPFEFASQIAAI